MLAATTVFRNTPRDTAANWCQRFELDSLASTQRLLADDLQANHNSSSSIAPRMLRTLIVSDCMIIGRDAYTGTPASKKPIRTKGKRNDFLFFRATVSYHPRHWGLPWLWRFDHPRYFWLWLTCL